MLTLRISPGGRLRGSLSFQKGRLISAESVCASFLIPPIVPASCGSHQTEHPSSLGSTRNVGKLCVKPSPFGGFDARGLLGKAWAQHTWRQRQKGESFTLLETRKGSKTKSWSNIERITLGQAGFGFLLSYYAPLKETRLTISLKEAHMSPWTNRAHQ